MENILSTRRNDGYFNFGPTTISYGFGFVWIWNDDWILGKWRRNGDRGAQRSPRLRLKEPKEKKARRCYKEGLWEYGIEQREES